MNTYLKYERYHLFQQKTEGKSQIIVAKCVSCKKLIRGLQNVSSNFITHIKVQHANIYNKFKSMKFGSSNGSAQDKFEEKLLNFITDAALPISVVDRPTFVALFEDTDFKVICRQTAMKKMEVRYSDMISTIKSNISASKYFCTTADIWSGNHRSFFGYTCHWLTEDFERKSVALACKRLFGKHSAELIFSTINDLNTDFGINASNLVMAVTDNGSNFVKAFKDHGLESVYDLQNENDEEQPSFENEVFLPKHHRCSSHTLNLLATTDLVAILKVHKSLYSRHKTVISICLYKLISI